MNWHDLPVGSNPQPLAFPHFPTRLQAVIWRNWGMVPVARLARVLRAGPEQIRRLAGAMGLPSDPPVEESWLKRGYLHVIRQNWHLLPYPQLLALIGWSADRMDYVLREDDFLWGKLGGLKPAATPVYYAPLTPAQRKETSLLRARLRQHFPRVTTARAHAFEFLRRFRVVKPTVRRRPGPPRPGEVVLDGSWTVRPPPSGKRATVFVERFVERMRQRWGIEMVPRSAPTATGNIEMVIRPDGHLLAESHRIEVDRSRIRITAVDEVGLLRGLQWLEEKMEQRGGPFLRVGRMERKTRFDPRLVYPYCALYGDPLLDPEFTPPPEGLLAEYARLGVNGIWLQAILYTLVPLAKAPELSARREERLDNLRRLTERAADFGIGVYLYLNEPRGMPLSFFKKYPDWKGVVSDVKERASLCTSQPAVREYLRSGVAEVFRQAPELAGVFTITMSENVTNCWCHAQGRHCPHCGKRRPWEVVAEVNRLIAEGAWRAKPQARVIAWTWGWQYPGMSARKAIPLLPRGVEVMCTSEEAMPVGFGGINTIVYDYSIGRVGPGKRALGRWRQARARGLRTVAKVQLNTTWECAAAPYLPVMNLVRRHLQNLDQAGVTGLMLSWTLGGAPSFNLKLAARHYWRETRGPAVDRLRLFAIAEFGGRSAADVCRAWRSFSAAIQEFPFMVPVAYLAPQNVGPMNLLFDQSTGYRATMVGFPYDDLASWRSLYPEDVFERQFDRLSAGWLRGLQAFRNARRHIEAGKRAAFAAHERVALAGYLHFRSTGLQIAFVRIRDRLERAWDSLGTAEQQRLCRLILRILAEERRLAKTLHRLVLTDSTIGYEASNQYVYEPQALREKVVNCEHLREIYQAKQATIPGERQRLR